MNHNIWECNFCVRKEFPGKNRLRQHVRINHEKKPCPQCGKCFTSDRLNTHIISVHTEDHLKPFVCKICGKGFAKIKMFETHMNIHTGAKPHKCKYCGRGFADLANTKMHEKTQHEGYKRGQK